MQKKEFRFGVVLTSEAASRAEWIAKCRRAEDLGYDVISVSDHLNLTSPFPSAQLAAEATERPRIGTYVLNACFHNPVLLARDLRTLDDFLDGRLEAGIGTGYVAQEFESVGIEFGTPGSRVDRLATALREVRDAFAGRRRPGLLVGGHGDRVLRMAARTCDIVSFVGARFQAEYGRMTIATAEEMRERVGYARRMAGERAPDLEFNLLSKATVLTGDRRAGAESVRRYGPDLTTEQLLAAPTLFIGTPAQVGEQVHELREAYGISYVTVLEHTMEPFGEVIAELR
ncbi:TIGR03621 family F420-dependent LLM class oxidoreductase [Streptomyces boncukensis]|uniref:TIGR03621 family F420-dependent LLM class oxidoreductase n=1 Tax=Streptomyces boncukensis TaxID=2711219 RepID=A0A6G4X6P5_9ACTN|nr:TIGR03621 family F420-dependent LLM class oxidoreductase [Streptomyces boncukensis]NGO72341.1 TIGR03621 family F420-dependent LLM class oxidoreductase [Streptomyces boncukensis]